jgi:amino acid transporter
MEMAGEEGGATLRREGTLVGLLFASVGGIVGSGWLFGPLNAAKTAGPAALVAWVIGGIAVLLLSFVYAELTTAFPRGGAVIAFPKLSHGSLIAMVMSWVVVLGYISVAPAEVLAVLKYAHNYLPNFVPANEARTPRGYGEAAALLAIFVALNFYGIRWLLRLNTTIVWWKLAIPALTIILLIIAGGNFGNLTSHGFAPSGVKGILAAVSTSGIVFSYLGFRQAVELAGESTNPRRNLPIAVVGSVVIGVILYCGLQVALMAAVNPRDLAHGWARLSFAGIAGPFAGLASLLGFGWLAVLLYIDAVVSPAGTGIIYATTSARVLYAIGQERLMGRWLATLNGKGVPVVGLALAFIGGALFLLPFPSWQKIVTFISSAVVLSYGIGPVVLLTLRRTMPVAQHPRPFTIAAPRLIGGLAFIISNLIIYWSGYKVDSWLFAMLAVFFFIYMVYELIAAGGLAHLEWRGAWWLIPYFLGMWLLTFLGPKDLVGGVDFIPYPVDLVVVAGFSIVIMMLAVASGMPDPEEARATILAPEPELLGPVPAK